MGFYEAVEPSCEPGVREEIKATGVNVRGLQNKLNQGSVYYLMRFITRLCSHTSAVYGLHNTAGGTFPNVSMVCSFFTHLKI